MTPDERLMLAEQGAADPELMGATVSAEIKSPEALRATAMAAMSPAEAMREAAAARAGAEAAMCREMRDKSGVGAIREQWQFAFAAAKTIQNGIASLPLPADPRDAEIERLRAALTEIENATRAASGYLDVNRATVWRINDHARAALAQSEDAK